MIDTQDTPPRTLDQQRAAMAWQWAVESRAKLPPDAADKYRNLAKGAPALLLNSGLMPTLAFYQGKRPQKGHSPEGQLLDDLMGGLVLRLKPKPLPKNFAELMAWLHQQDASSYLRATDEALELLKWLRQFVDAVKPATPAEGGAR